jgi:hypothetical protein
MDKENAPLDDVNAMSTISKPIFKASDRKASAAVPDKSRKVPAELKVVKNAVPMVPSPLSYVAPGPSGIQRVPDSFDVAESASKIYEYSSIMIRKNDGIVREQQDLVFEQTRRQIERLEMLQEMQVDSITRILQKQVRF